MFYQLTDRFVVKSDPATTWAFFSSAENLPRITPKWLSFELLTPEPINIGLDTVLDYRIKSNGIPLRWKSLIVAWEPMRLFVDLQVKGPYATWCHRHTFEPTEEGVICSDRVVYKLPGGPIGRMVHAAMVKRQLVEIFRYRREMISKELGWGRAIQQDVEVTRVGGKER